MNFYAAVSITDKDEIFKYRSVFQAISVNKL